MKAITVAELARWLDGKAEGETTRSLTGVASLEGAGEGITGFFKSFKDAGDPDKWFG